MAVPMVDVVNNPPADRDSGHMGEAGLAEAVPGHEVFHTRKTLCWWVLLFPEGGRHQLRTCLQDFRFKTNLYLEIFSIRLLVTTKTVQFVVVGCNHTTTSES